MNAESDASAPATPGSPLEGVLASSGERYASLFTHHPHATYSVDRNGYYTDANPRALAMTGLTLQQMRETHFALVIHPEDVHIIKDGFDRALAGEPNLAEARVLHVDNQVIDIRCTMIPAVVDGEIVGVHGVTEDITEAKQVLRQLEEANSAKARFLANTSHEIRTPLASVIGAMELLMEAELETAPEHFVHVAHRNSQRLAQLVDGILDYSRLQAHQIVLHPKPISIREIVEGIEAWAVASASPRGLTISFVVDETVPMTAVGDGLRISQVVTNLVQNAIKFTKSGGVAVRVGSRIEAPLPHGTTANPDIWVDFTVTDTGIGIADDDVHTIFDPFTQADPSDTRDHEGLGLSLTICRDLVDLMGGQLHSFSKIGEGTTFTFNVPLGHFSTCDDPPAPDADTGSNLSVNTRRSSQIGRLQAGSEGMGAGGLEWRDVVETLPQIVWVTRPDGYHVYFNQHWMDFTGLSLKESLGDGWNPPFHPADRALARRLWNKATHTGQPYEIEYRLRRHDGVYRWMLGRALPLRNTAGEIVNWFGTCTDISELKAALQGAAEMQEKLERQATPRAAADAAGSRDNRSSA